MIPLNNHITPAGFHILLPPEGYTKNPTGGMAKAFLQNIEEFLLFIDILNALEVKTIIEVGTYWQGTALAFSQVVQPRKGFVLSLDIQAPPHGWVEDYPEWKKNIVFLFGSGGNIATKVKEIVSGSTKGQVDALFIDGDHSYGAVKSDHITYGPMAKKCVAFHDICQKLQGYGVYKYWKEVKTRYKYTELIGGPSILTGQQDHGPGIGIIYGGLLDDPTIQNEDTRGSNKKRRKNPKVWVDRIRAKSKRLRRRIC